MKTPLKSYLSIIFGSLLIGAPLSGKSYASTEHVDEAEEVIVLAPSNLKNSDSLLKLRKDSLTAVDGSNAEQISRQGDSNVASALRRVTGVSIFDGKFVIIRGLGDRYSLARYNDLFISPLEPNKKQIALDLFPTNTLEAIQVEKTTSANLPADFGGGLVNLRSRSNLGFKGFKAQIGFFVEGSTSLKVADGNDRNLISPHFGNRNLPNIVREALSSGRPLVLASPSVKNGYSLEELKEFQKQMPKTYDLVQKEEFDLPRLQIQASHEHRLFEKSYEHAESVSFQQEVDRYTAKQKYFDVSSESQLALAEDNALDLNETNATMSLQHSGKLFLNSKNSVNIDLMGVIQADEAVRLKDQKGPGVNDYLRRKTEIELNHKKLITGQLRHTYLRGDLESNTGISLSKVQKESPDVRTYTYRQRKSNDNLELDPEVSGNSRTWETLTEDSRDFKWDAKWKLVDLPVHLRGGLQFLDRQRGTESYRLQFVKNYLSGQAPDLTRTPNEIYADADSWILVNQTQATDSYGARQSVRAAFLEFAWDLTDSLKLVMGQRLESTLIQVENMNFQTRDVLSGTLLEANDLLPSLSFIYIPNSGSKVLTAMSETMALPDFRELSPVRYLDYDSGIEARGDSGLKPVRIRSADFRYEVYPQEDEVFSVGAFYKKFDQPIEDSFLPIAGSLLKVPRNVSGAELKGLEGEIRLSARRWMRELRFIHFSMNGSLMESQVLVSPGEEGNLTNTQRPLQGQSPWLFNSEIYYQRDPKGLMLSLSYNVAGSRIYAVGTDARPDVLEMPFHQADISASLAPTKKSKWVGRWRNILDSPRELKMGNETTYFLKKGPELSITYSEVF